METDGAVLVGERRDGAGPTVVFLHAGVTDRRSWQGPSALLEDLGSLVVYDRRGFGETPPSATPFSHVDDLMAVLDELGADGVWLVGSSVGGGLALDTALSAPSRVAGLVLLAPSPSGAPEPTLDPDTARFDRLLEDAFAAGDMAEVNRLEAWLWLDGPSQPEGRVGGQPRALLKEMNGIVLGNDVPEDAGSSDVSAWPRLDEVEVAVTVACGELDVPFLVEQGRELATRVPDGRFVLLTGVAHLPQLERPEAVASLVRAAVRDAEG